MSNLNQKIRDFIYLITGGISWDFINKYPDLSWWGVALTILGTATILTVVDLTLKDEKSA